MKSKKILIKFNLPGFHYWAEAKNFLQDKHRHQFYWEIEIPVTHDNRDIEFIEMKERMIAVIKDFYPTQTYNGVNMGVLFNKRSCETIAEECWDLFSQELEVKASKITVLEDNENGAIFHNE